MKRFLLWVRTTFVSGVIAILPVGLTVWVVVGLFRFIDGFVGEGSTFGSTVERALGRWIPGLGIFVTIALILAIGVITRNVVGRTVHYYFERLFFAVPGIGKMYGTFKQFSNALLNRTRTTSFKKVVMFEFPKEGVYTLGVVTNEELGRLRSLAGEDCVLVYAPTAPNPLSGYMLIVPKRLVRYVDMPVEDALSMVVSSGSALPDSLRDKAAADEQERSRPRLFRFRKRT